MPRLDHPPARCDSRFVARRGDSSTHMDSVTATPASRPAAVTAETTVATPPSDLHLAALLQPALIYADGWLPVTCRLWLEWAMLAAQDALEHVLDRPVAIYPAGPDPGSPREAVFAVAFDH